MSIITAGTTEADSGLTGPRKKADCPPSLETGDHLTRFEFERRYNARPDIKYAELIEGIVYMPSPTRFERHGRPHSHVNFWLGLYEAATSGVLSASNASVRLDLDNMPQPDAFLLIDPARGGRTRTSDDDFVEGAPELITEVTASSVSYDLYEKKDAYRRNGVREYVVLLTEENRALWFVLREGQFVDLSADSAGVFRSEVFPGLWLDGSALLAANLIQVQSVLQQGLDTAEHAAFVQRLAVPAT